MADESSEMEVLATSVMEKLNLQTTTTDGAAVLLTDILKQCTINATREEYTDRLIEKGAISYLTTQLQHNSALSKQCAPIIAEIAKSESGRQACVQPELIKPLVSLLSADEVQLVLQTCRALGNISYDFDTGRDVIDSSGGILALLDVLRRYANCSDEGCSELRLVASGFLLNVSNTHGVHIASCDVERPFGIHKLNSQTDDAMRTITLNLGLDSDMSQQSIQEKLITNGAMEILQQYLQLHLADEGLCNMALLCIDSLLDSDLGRTRAGDCGLAVTAGRLLSDASRGCELQQLIVELLANLAETDSVKEQIAKSDMIRLLLDVIHKNQDISSDEDSVTLLKLTSDLIVLLLIADESMLILYDNGNGLVYKEICEWLKSTNQQLQLAGALAMGNFARGDDQCKRMVSEGISSKLMTLLKPKDSSSSASDIVNETSPTLQHAIFSCLRNLAIPVCNKSILLTSAQLDTTLLYIHSEMATVHFRLLGLYRMLTDGQKDISIYLGTNEEFLTFVVKCCSNDEHAGVKGEATRLLAWLMKHSRGQASVAEMSVKCQGLPHLVTMTMADHAVMQNEAIMALTLVTSEALLTVESDLLACELPSTIHKLLTNEECLAEILCNVLTLVNSCYKSDKLKSGMTKIGVGKAIKTLTKHKEKIVKKQASLVYSLFDSGS